MHSSPQAVKVVAHGKSKNVGAEQMRAEHMHVHNKNEQQRTSDSTGCGAPTWSTIMGTTWR